MKCPFDLKANVEYTIGRFNNTIIMYDGHPCYIQQVNNDLTVKAVTSHKGKFTERLDNPLFDFGPIKLGHIIYNKEVVFLSRRPSRQWKQGLSPNNLLAVNSRGERQDIDFMKLISNASFLCRTQGLIDELGKPEKIKRGFNFLSDDLLIERGNQREGVLHYRGKMCGVVQGKEFKIFQDKMFLKEKLEELGGYVN